MSIPKVFRDSLNASIPNVTFSSVSLKSSALGIATSFRLSTPDVKDRTEDVRVEKALTAFSTIGRFSSIPSLHSPHKSDNSCNDTIIVSIPKVFRDFVNISIISVISFRPFTISSTLTSNEKSLSFCITSTTCETVVINNPSVLLNSITAA